MQLEERSLFNLPIKETPINEDMVPTFIPHICNFIEEFVSTVGIFRCSGNYTLLKEMSVVFNCMDVAIPPCASVHDVANFLKKWLMELPEPLLTPSIYNSRFRPNDAESIRSILSDLHVINRKTYAYVIYIFDLVLKNSTQNQMSLYNLTSCFLPSLTQQTKDLHFGFPFPFIYKICYYLLNDDHNDFVLDRPFNQEFLTSLIQDITI